MRSIPTRSLIALAVSAAAAGCELADSRYTRERELDGDPLMDVESVPRERPAGTVRVDIVGAAEMALPRFGTLAVVHVQIRIANDRDEQPWIIDARHQRIEVRGRGRFAPLPGDQEPVSTIARHATRTLDLRFAMPLALDQAPDVEVLWQLTTGTRIVGERTRFVR